MPKEGRLEFEDLVKGRMKKKAEDTQDFVIVRSDGSPVFHLANVVDDMLQNITLVIRGDDHVENTFKHIELFKALGYTPPQYAHLPMIVNNMGKPYSKRDGAAFVGEFREQGYLPETLFNFLLLLGWAPGDDREVMTRDEMIEAFSLERCKSSPSRFDMKKLRWMNGEYIAKLPKEQFKAELVARLKAAGLPEQPLNGDLDVVIGPVQPRTKVYTELPANCIYFFTEEYPFDEAAVAKRLKQPGVRELLEEMAARFEALEDFTEESTEAIVRQKSEELGGMGPVVHPIRVAVSGITEGPGLFELLVLVGKERVVARLRKAAELAVV
jgi:glutamyl-tRNA synthetase